MDQYYWQNETGWKSLAAAEILPLSVMFIASLIAIVCNIMAAATYWQQRSGLCHNPGNIFTVNLIMDDLILSGIAIPLLISLETINYSNSAISMDSLCLGTRCAFIFSAVASAIGNSLLALDRGDITLRPSKRFFRRKHAIVAVTLAWICSLSSLFMPIWTSSLFRTSALKRKNFTISVSKSIINAVYNNSDETENILCDVSCNSKHCSANEKEYITQSAIQTLLYVSAAFTIFFTYRRILLSVKRRDVRRATKNMGTQFGFYSSKKKTKLCIYRWCTWCNNEQEAHPSEINDTKQEAINRKTCKESVSEVKKTIKDTRAKANEVTENEKGDNNEVNNETDKEERVQFLKQTKSMHPGRAHFASVALSVQAFIALKRIVSEKIEMKRRKHRYLQRMTVTITLAFIICWAPYHLFPFVLVITGQFPLQFWTCELQVCLINNNEKFDRFEYKTIFTREPTKVTNVVFLWIIALVSLSSIANPFLYSFSREKIRIELQKLFCNITNSPKNKKTKNSTQKKQNKSTCRITSAFSKWKSNVGNSSNLQDMEEQNEIL